MCCLLQAKSYPKLDKKQRMQSTKLGFIRFAVVTFDLSDHFLSYYSFHCFVRFLLVYVMSTVSIKFNITF